MEKDTKNNYHVDCKPQQTKIPEKPPEFKPKSEVRVYSSSEQAQEQERNEIVRKRLAMAKKGISEELDIPEREIHQDSPVLVEYMRQLSSEKWFLKEK